MASNAQAERIVANGGWVERTYRYQPKARFCQVMSIIWFFPSLGALTIIGSDVLDWVRASSFLAAIQQVRFEQWVAIGLLAVHPLFVFLWLRLRRSEAVREGTIQAESPEVDLRKLD